MAEDTRKDPTSQEPEGFQALPRSSDQEIHRKPRAFIHRPDEDPEAAAEARKNASLLEAAKTIQVEDFTKVAQIPCLRNAMLPGIGGGVAIGAARFVIGGSILAACNWASGSFIGVSLVMYQYCQRRRKLQKEGVIRAVKVLDQKQALKDAQAKVREIEANGGPKSTTAVGSVQAGTAPAKAAVEPRQEDQEKNFWSTFKFW